MHAVLRQLMTETVDLARYTGQDAYGEPTYAAPVTVPAHLEAKVQLRPTAQGLERVEQTRLFLDGAVPIALRDKVILADGTAPAMTLLYHVRDTDGSVHHHEVTL